MKKRIREKHKKQVLNSLAEGHCILKYNNALYELSVIDIQQNIVHPATIDCFGLCVKQEPITITGMLLEMIR